MRNTSSAASRTAHACLPAMRSVLLLLESLACVALSSAGGQYPYYPQYPTTPPPSPLEGTPCVLPNGYLPYTCEAGTLIESRSEVLPLEAYGPNVCRLTDVFLAREEEYVFKQKCSWQYDSKQYVNFLLCFLECLPSGKCTNSSRNNTLENVYCCEGFTTGPALKPSYTSVPFKQFVPEDNTPTGCPIAKGHTLLRCLEIHGYYQFIELAMIANLTHLLNSADMKYTIFAPPDASLDNISRSSMEAVAQFIKSHIVEGEVHAEDILYDDELTSLSGGEIFTSTIESYFYRPLVYQAPYRTHHNYHNYGSYSQHQGDYVLLETERYVSGARIEVADACAPPSKGLPPAGVLHLVDRPLPTTTQSLASVLEQDRQFTMFVELLDRIDLTRFLRTLSPQTVFAPVNAAFSVYSEAVWDCLTSFELTPLNNLLLYHILNIAEYSSTMIARDVLYTRLLLPLSVEEGDDGQILLSPDGQVHVPVTQPDILASNGVAHGIPALLMPSEFTLGDCAYLATTPTSTSSIVPSPTSSIVPPSTSSIVPPPSLPSSSSPPTTGEPTTVVPQPPSLNESMLSSREGHG